MLLLLLALQAAPVQQDSIPAPDSLPRITLREALKRSTSLDPDYVQAVGDMVDRTSTEIAPWTLVEANDKRWARVKVLRTINQALEAAFARDKK